ncbi:MAG: putative esterase, partial [Paenibacillus sp.]|nr:putative esterase [Paenibacillus sp.]
LELEYEEGPGSHNWGFWDLYIQRVLAWLPIRS